MGGFGWHHSTIKDQVRIVSPQVTMLVFGIITSFMPFYWGFVFTWWITGTMAIACYTAAFVWTMEICAGRPISHGGLVIFFCAGKWKIYLGMSMNYSWPCCRLIIAGLAWTFRDWHVHLQVGIPIVFFHVLLECSIRKM